MDTKDSTSLDPPSVLRRILNFSKAFVRHVADGLEKRSDEEIKSIFENHCLKCTSYRDGFCHHNFCGCNVDNDQRFFNKLSWKSEYCPRGFWK